MMPLLLASASTTGAVRRAEAPPEPAAASPQSDQLRGDYKGPVKFPECNCGLRRPELSGSVQLAIADNNDLEVKYGDIVVLNGKLTSVRATAPNTFTGNLQFRNAANGSTIPVEITMGTYENRRVIDIIGKQRRFIFNSRRSLSTTQPPRSGGPQRRHHHPR
jgi:hypothetical protein